MKKFYLVEQPPLSEKFNFLIDEQTEFVSETIDYEKIKYNLELINNHSEFSMQSSFIDELKVRLLMSTNGITSVLVLGKYIVTLELSRDENKGKMMFFEFIPNVEKSRIKNLLEKSFNNTIVDEWIKCYDELSLKLNNDHDNVNLLIPTF